jgi:Rrf2 family protein
MLVPQKTQYALRAVFELAKRRGEGPIRIADVAEAQSIPLRFLEVILNQLKQGGFVESKRGSGGGYILLRDPDDLAVGEILSFVQGPVIPVGCMEGTSKGKCPLHNNCVFLPMWERVQNAILDVYQTTTFQDLIDKERERAEQYVPSYTI